MVESLENGAEDTDSFGAPSPIEKCTENVECPQKKKRRLSNGVELDQYDCKFGIRLDNEGEVVAMTDESEISSLNEEEAIVLREKYCELKACYGVVSKETQLERDYQIRELESALRLEEAKLAMLKKMRSNQQVSLRNGLPELNKKSVPVMTQNASGTAYKPTLATPQNVSKINGVNKSQKIKSAKPNTSPAGNFQMTPQHQAMLQKLVENGTCRPEQIAAVLHSLNPATLAHFAQTFTKATQRDSPRDHGQQQQRDQQEQQRRQEQQRQQKEEQQKVDAARARESAQSNQQKIAAARTQLRRHLEQQLLQLPAPKAPLSDMSFIPNASQPDFCYLLGLDLVVQRNLKDKAVFKKVEFDPYVCEECGTDFTPNWKAIAGDKGDLHLYCEQCVRQAQKRKIRHERTILYKKAFQKIGEQEKEFERQVSAGKFNDAFASSNSSTSKESLANGTSSVASTSTTPTSKLNSGAFNVASLSNSSCSPSVKSANLQTTSSASSAMASPSTITNRNLPTNLSRNSQLKPDPKKPNTNTISSPSSSSSRAKRTSSNSNNAVNNILAAMTSNTSTLNQLQQQIFMANMRNIHPMLAAMMANPQLIQLYQTLSQRQPSGGSNNIASSALLQAFLQTQGNQGGNNSPTNNSASSLNLMANPQLMRQFNNLANNTNLLQNLKEQMSASSRKK